MTVESTVSRVQYSTNGTTGPFSVPFYFITEGELSVVYADSTGAETELVLNTDYSVAGEGDPAGGSVTTTTAYAAGGTITIRRIPSLLQETDYTDTDRFPAVAHERALDRAMMAAQYLKEITDRCIQIPVSGTESVSLPDASDRAGKTLTFDSNGNVSATAPADGTSAALAADLLSYATPTRGTGMVGHDDALNYTSGAGLGLIARGVSVRNPSFGIAGDGVTNDTSSILTAANRAVALGVPLIFDGSIHAIDSITFPDDLAIEFNGATLQDRLGTTSDSALITFGARTRIDTLKVTIPAGLRRDRVVRFLGNDSIVSGRLSVISVSQQANTGDNDDAAVSIIGDNVKINAVYVENFDQCYRNTGDDTFIGKLDAQSYVTCFQNEDAKRLTVLAGHQHTLSPNGGLTAGHNTWLFRCNTNFASEDIVVMNQVSEDAGEHCVRIGGPASHRNIKWQGTIKRAGRSSFKILGTDLLAPTTYNYNIDVDIVTIDGGVGSGGSAENSCALLAQWVDGLRARVRNRAEGSANSHAYGLLLDGVRNVKIHPDTEITATTLDGAFLHAEFGDNVDIGLYGTFKGCGRHGVNVLQEAGKTLTGLYGDVRIISPVTNGLNASNLGTITAGLSELRARITGAGGTTYSATAAANGIKIHISSNVAPTDTDAAIGSTWSDTSNFHVLKTGPVWTAAA